MFKCVYLNPTIDKTLVFGDFRIGETNRPASSLIQGGGKALNAAKVFLELGSEVKVIGCVFERDSQYIESAGIPSEFLRFRAGSSRINTKIFSDGVITEINEAGMSFSEEMLTRLFDRVVSDVDEGDFVLLAGSLPKGAPSDYYAQMVRELNHKGARCIVDAEGEPLTLALREGVYFIKPNDRELELLIGKKFSAPADMISAVRETGAEVAAVSLGAEGGLICDSSRAFRAYPLSLKVASTVGAGDSMVAGACHALSKGMGLAEALRLGSACAAASIELDGTGMCRIGDIEKKIPLIKIEEL